MILYNASTSEGLRNFARRFSNTNSTSYVDNDIDPAINAWYDLFISEMLDAMDDWDVNGEVATTNLVSGQQEYAFPTDILKIKRIEITYDGTKWYPVSRIDNTEISVATDTTSIANNFTNSEPYADIFDTSIFLYPIPSANVTGGLKIWYEKLPTKLSAATDEPSFARPFHKGLAYGAAKDYLEQYPEVEGNQMRLSTCNANIRDYILRLRTFYSKRNQDRPYDASGRDVDYGYDI